MTYKFPLTHLLKLITALLAAILLLGCSESKLTPIPKEGTILAFGDSLTVGVGSSDANSYPFVLSDLTGLQVINSGVSGETTDRGLQRLPRVLNETSPDLLILIEGGNDILRNRNLTETKANLAAMITLADSRGVPVVLLGVPEKKLFSDSAPFYDVLAEEFQLVFEPELIADLLRTPAYKSDAVHLNDKGYRKLAESIHDLLKENGALP